MYACATGTAGFRPEFFLPYRQKAQAPVACTGDAPRAGAGISYSRELHGLNREFCAGPLFERYREEMRGLLSVLTAFAVDGIPPERGEAIANGFHRFFDRRFHAPYQEGYAELIDGPGKRALESLCALVRDDAIPLHVRQTAVKNLSASLDVCEGGTLSNLIATQRSLLMAAGGIKARFWKMKEDCTRGILQDAVCRKFGQRKSYTDYEIHYVNAAWNHLADEIGLEPVADPRAAALLAAEPDFLNACRASVLAAMTPDNFAFRLAEQCLAAFKSAAPADQQTIAYGQGIPAWFDAALDDILLDLRLGAERLTLHAFVQLDDRGERYRLRTDATLIALALLDAIHDEGLMDDIPVQRAEWRDETGQRAVALAYGGLAWQSLQADGVTASPGWSARDGSQGLLTIADLHRWKAARGADGPDISAIEVRAAIRSDDPEALLDTPAECLLDADTVLFLLVRLGDDGARRYLNTHLSHFRDHFPPGERAALIDGVMHMGDAGFVLASSWYPDMYALLGETRMPGGATRLQRWMAQRNAAAIDAARLLAEQGWAGAKPAQPKSELIYRLLCGKDDTPMLYDAMVGGNVAGLGAWHRLLCSPAVLPYVGATLPDLLIADRKGGVSALASAMHRDRADGIDAYRALLADPAITPKIHSRLPTLVAGTGSRFGRSTQRANAMIYGLDGGAASAILAYGGLLLDPAIFPEIREDMPKLFGIRRANGRAGARRFHLSGLWWAMDKGHAGAVGAYHQIVARAPILECLKDSLPALITGKDPLGQVTPLYSALDKGHAAVIDAYHGLVADPVLTPFIRQVLPRAMLAEGRWGAPGLAAAMQKGHAQAVVSYTAMLADDAILPFIRSSLPGLLQATPWGETSGLAQALAAGHTAVLAAFHAFLVEQKILPEIAYALPHLLVAKHVSGAAGLAPAVQEGHTRTVAAYRAMLTDTRIVPYIEDRIRRRTARSRASAAVRPAAAMPKPVSPSAAASAWEAEVDQWLALYIDGRPSRPGFVTRVALRIQQWTAA